MKNFLFLVLLCVSFYSKAQSPDPVKWSFYSIQEKEAGHYTICAKASIEASWHVFSNEPGGDGLLIPTEMKIDDTSLVKKIGLMKIDGKLITKEMEGIGMVNFYEHEALFKISIEHPSNKTISGTISYQLCNDNMCLPPTDVPFSIKF